MLLGSVFMLVDITNDPILRARFKYLIVYFTRLNHNYLPSLMTSVPLTSDNILAADSM